MLITDLNLLFQEQTNISLTSGFILGIIFTQLSSALKTFTHASKTVNFHPFQEPHSYLFQTDLNNPYSNTPLLFHLDSYYTCHILHGNRGTSILICSFLSDYNLSEGRNYYSCSYLSSRAFSIALHIESVQ